MARFFVFTGKLEAALIDGNPMPLTPLSPKRNSPIGYEKKKIKDPRWGEITVDDTSKPIYGDKEGNPILGLKDNAAKQSYDTAQGGTTWSGNVISGGQFFKSIPRKFTMGDQSEPESGVKRNEEGDRTVIGRDGKEHKVGDRINARAGDGGGAKPTPSSYTPTPSEKFTKPFSINDPEFQKKGNAVFDAKQEAAAKDHEGERAAKKLPKFEQETADAWAAHDANGKPSRAAAPPPAQQEKSEGYDPGTLARVRKAGSDARIFEGKEAASKYPDAAEYESEFAKKIRKRKNLR